MISFYSARFTFCHGTLHTTTIVTGNIGVSKQKENQKNKSRNLAYQVGVPFFGQSRAWVKRSQVSNLEKPKGHFLRSIHLMR